MSNIVTIAEEFTLPSKGLIYDQRFDPTIELRSMTVAEEMKRLTYTERPFKLMSDIIEDCLLTKLPVVEIGATCDATHTWSNIPYGSSIYSTGRSIKIVEQGLEFSSGRSSMSTSTDDSRSISIKIFGIK